MKAGDSICLYVNVTLAPPGIIESGCTGLAARWDSI